MNVNMNVDLTKRLSLRSVKDLYRIVSEQDQALFEQGPQVVERQF
jgi:hypothetical protein